MKYSKIKILLVGVVAVLFTGCKKFLDINWNPSVPQEVSGELYLAPIIYHMANGYAQDQRIINKFTQAMVGSSTATASVIWEQHGWPENSDVGGVQWRTVYFNHGLNLEKMIADSKAKENNELTGIGYAIKAWDFQTLTDYHGPMPINDLYHDTKLIYDYVDQPEVYKRVIALCDTALQYLNTPSDYDYISLFRKYDYLFSGNMERWKKFVYGIKAMNYSRYINKPDFLTNYADSVIKYIDLSFESNNDDACVKFTGTNTDNSNLYGSKLGYLSSTYYNKQGSIIVNYLAGGVRGEPLQEPKIDDSVDPRLSRMLKFTGVDSIYMGAIPNDPASNAISTVVNHYLFKNLADFPLFTYSQQQFMKAEVLLKQGKKEEAHIAYIAGIQSHMGFVNKYTVVTDENITELPKEITSEEIDFYLASSEVAQTPDELTLSDIMGQKFIALWGWGGYDIWVDMRKYRYDTSIFRQFQEMQAGSLTYGDYTYRVRPRFNSEYMWNVEALERFGALDDNYVIQPLWFVLESY